MSYRYRCGQCCTTSPPTYTRSAAEHEGQQHRDRFHGGHIPDDEAILEPEPFHLADVPRNQFVFVVCAVVALVIATLVKVL